MHCLWLTNFCDKCMDIDKYDVLQNITTYFVKGTVPKGQNQSR